MTHCIWLLTTPGRGHTFFDCSLSLARNILSMTAHYPWQRTLISLTAHYPLQRTHILTAHSPCWRTLISLTAHYPWQGTFFLWLLITPSRGHSFFDCLLPLAEDTLSLTVHYPCWRSHILSSSSRWQVRDCWQLPETPDKSYNTHSPTMTHFTIVVLNLLQFHRIFYAIPSDILCNSIGCFMQFHRIFYAIPSDILCNSIGYFMQFHRIFYAIT
jgi:hypothetical protein